MEVTGPAPVGGGQPLESIRPAETATPAGQTAPAGGADRVEFSAEAQAQAEVAGAQGVEGVAEAGKSLPALTVDPNHAAWLAEKPASESAAILAGEQQWLLSQGYNEADVTAQVGAYQAQIEQLRAAG